MGRPNDEKTARPGMGRLFTERVPSKRHGNARKTDCTPQGQHPGCCDCCGPHGGLSGMKRPSTVVHGATDQVTNELFSHSFTGAIGAHVQGIRRNCAGQTKPWRETRRQEVESNPPWACQWRARRGKTTICEEPSRCASGQSH